jgi:hypothetical protein
METASDRDYTPSETEEDYTDSEDASALAKLFL